MPDAVAEFSATATKWIATIKQIEAETGKSVTRIGEKGVQLATTANRAVAASGSAAAAKVTTTMAGAAKSTQAVSGSLRAVAIQLPDVASQLSAGASPFTILTQQGLQVVQQVGMIPGALGSVAAALLPLAPAVLALGTAAALAFGEYTTSVKEAAAANDGGVGSIDGLSIALVNQATLAKQGKTALESYRDAVADSALQAKVLSGEITEQEAAIIRQQGSLRDKLRPALIDAAAEMVRAQDEVVKLTAAVEEYNISSEVGPSEAILTDPRADLAAAQERLRLAEQSLSGMKQERKEGDQLIVTLEGLKAGRKGAASAARDQAAAQREMAALMAEEQAGYDGVLAIAERYANWNQTESERIMALRDEDLQAIEDYALMYDQWGQAAVLRAQVEMGAEEQLAARRDELRDELEAKQQAQYDREKARQDAYYAEAKVAAMDALGTVSTFALDMATMTAESSSEVSERWLNWYKAAAVAEATVSTITAAVKAFSSLAGIPYVGVALGTAAAAAVVAAGGVQIAEIANTQIPSYHLGGTAPDEQLAMVRSGESYLTARGTQAIGGQQGVDAANRGESVGGATVVYQVYRDKIYQDALRDQARAPGSAIRAIVGRSSSKIPGRRPV